MAYTTVDKSTTSFNSIKYTGNSSAGNITGVGLRPDWTWIKKLTDDAEDHAAFDSVRGVDTPKLLSPNAQAAVETHGNNGYVSAFISDGFTVATNGSGGDEWQYLNHSGDTFIAWNWKAGGTAPTKTYTVKVVSDSGNKFRFDDFGTSAVTLDLQEGGTYTFDTSDSSNGSHPFVLGTSSGVDGSYTTGVTYKLDGVTKTYSQYTSGYSSASSRQLIITLAASAPTLYYNCSSHSGMGGSINTNSTFGSSNFAGATQSTVSTNTAAGFSIIKYNGTGSQTTIGHELGKKPEWIVIKRLGSTEDWAVYHKANGAGAYISLNTTEAKNTNNNRFNVAPTSTVFTVNTHESVNYDEDYIAYCFTSKPGFSAFGAYTGNGNGWGPFTYTGFKPTTLIIKRVQDAGNQWEIRDNAMDPKNPADDRIFPSSSGVVDADNEGANLLSNGFKIMNNGGGCNDNGKRYAYMAFGQSIVGSNNIPATAK